MVSKGIVGESFSKMAPGDGGVYEREMELERFLFRPPGSLVMMLIRMETPVPPGELEVAVEKLVRMHPFLRSRVEIREDGTAYFTTEGAEAVGLKVVPKTSEDRYVGVIDEENGIPFHMDRGPLARIILLEHGSRPDILLYFHHVICDGISLVYLSRHLMEFLGDPGKEASLVEPVTYGAELVKAHPPGMVAKTMIKRINSQWRKRRVIFGEEEHQSLVAKSRRPEFRVWGFTEEETLSLREKCREEGVTINSALVTSILAAKRVVPGLAGRSDEMGFSVNVRERLPLEPGEACGLYASGVTFRLEYQGSRTFWDNARVVHRVSREKMGDDKALFGRRASTVLMDPTIFDAMFFSYAGEFEDPLIEKFTKSYGKPDMTALLTNLGGVQIPERYGPYVVDDVWFITGASAGGVPAVAASGIRGRLNISLPYYEHLLPLETVDALGDAIMGGLRATL